MPRTLLLALLLASAPACLAADEKPASPQFEGKRVIGATAILNESTTGAPFAARIDTGAKTCSLHIEEVLIEDPHEDMRKNIDKPARIRVVDREGKTHWIDTKIAETVRVKTSEEQERRYKVWLTLEHEGVKKKVHVTLNNRSHMAYPLLVGRNFLRGSFLVDVSREVRIKKKR